MSDDTEGRIRERAYKKWQQEGQPDGRADAHWQEARRELQMEGQLQSGQAGDASPRGRGSPNRLKTPDVIPLPDGTHEAASPRRSRARKKA